MDWRSREKDYVALLPAAGKGARMAPSPCSKEVYPVGCQVVNGQTKPKVISQYLLESLRGAGIVKAFIVIRDEKWDIPKYYKDGQSLDMNIAYMVTEPTTGHPFTLDKAYPFIRHANVALGYPDIYFRPADAFDHLLTEFEGPGSDVVLGMFPVSDPPSWDIVETDDHGGVTDIKLRGNSEVGQKYTWILTVWNSVFTEFMNEYLRGSKPHGTNGEELILDHVFLAALRQGLRITGVKFTNGEFWDIGTEHGLKDLVNLGRELIS